MYPVGTKDAGAADVVAADGQPITLKTYIWEYNSANVYLKAVSTPNADAGAEESWQKKGNGSIGEDGTTWAGNEAMNVAGCDPQFLYGVSAKNGNPSNTYKDFYEYNEDGDAVHRVVDAPYWAPGCGWLPEKGCYYTFTVKNDGQLKVALWVNKNLNSNPLYIVDAATKEPLNIADVNIVGFMQNNTFEKDADGNACGTNKYKFTEEYKIVQDVEGATPQNRPFFGYFTFNVKKDATYYIFSSKSQPGIFGYEFTAGATGGDQPGTDTPAADTKTWNFKVTKTANEVFAADATNWVDSNGDGSRWTYQPETSNSPIMVGGVELEDTKGLLFKANAGKIRLDRDNRLGLNGKDITVTIPGLKAGQTVTVKSQSASSSAPERYITPTNLNVTSGFVAGTEYVEVINVGTVAADGDVTITSTDGGINLYSIEVTSGSTGIGNIEVVAPQFNGAIYNLAGQKVGADYKGLVIKNGKKFINK